MTTQSDAALASIARNTERIADTLEKLAYTTDYVHPTVDNARKAVGVSEGSFRANYAKQVGVRDGNYRTYAQSDLMRRRSELAEETIDDEED